MVCDKPKEWGQRPRSLSENSLLKSSLPTFAYVSHFGGPPVTEIGPILAFVSHFCRRKIQNAYFSDRLLGLQRVLGLGSYKTAWALLHKLRRAMVRPGRDRLRGTVEVDETYWGGDEEGVVGRLTEEKDMIIVAAEEGSKGIGRIRLRRIPDTTRMSLHGFIEQAIEPGSTVRTDGLNAYLGLKDYVHDRRVQRRQPKGEHLLPLVHLVVSLLKRWLLGTHQGAIGHDYLDYYLDEFTFRFNRRKSASRGKLFYRLVQHAVQISPAPYDTIIKPRALGDG
jgi:transposase-like protein